MAVHWIHGVLAPAFALFLGGFSLLNLAGELRHPGFDANTWWIDFRPAPVGVARLLLLAAAVFLLAYCLRPEMSGWRRRTTFALSAVLLAACLWNAIHFYILLLRKDLQAGLPVPFSVLIALTLGVVLIALAQPEPAERNVKTVMLTAAAVGACMVCFPLAQMYCFGKTDYRRRADVAVVFGARAYADGRPSTALADRLRTGCSLYRDGLVRKLVFSGGPGDGNVHETEVMRRMATELGVPAEDILVDAEGINTHATVRNSIPMFRALGAAKVLAVSHFYHLPRVKMAYERASWTVYTVPAQESRVLLKLPYFLVREVVALWAYYLEPLAGKG